MPAGARRPGGTFGLADSAHGARHDDDDYFGATGFAHGLSRLAGTRSNQRVVERPRETGVVTAGELVTSAQRDRGAEDMEIPDKVAIESRQPALPPMVEPILPIASRQAALPPVVEHSQPMEKSGTDEIMANEDGLALSPPVVERV